MPRSRCPSRCWMMAWRDPLQVWLARRRAAADGTAARHGPRRLGRRLKPPPDRLPAAETYGLVGRPGAVVEVENPDPLQTGYSGPGDETTASRPRCW